MRYVDEFRDSRLARRLASAIAEAVDPRREYRLMEFCGGHTHAIFRHGVQALMPDNLRFVHGPGCPVCVLPVSCIDAAIRLARTPGVILCSYGDLLRVPGSGRRSLLTARARGADVRMVYSTLDALAIARDNPRREVVFLAIGFETTAPATALAIRQADEEGLGNFSVYCNHVLTPPAMRAILDGPDTPAIDGLLGPSHVSAIIGSRPYEALARRYTLPIVVAGFEPLDVMQSTLMLLRQIAEGRHVVENEYTRSVSRDGNRRAQALCQAVFESREHFAWRGLGELPHSGLRIRAAWRHLDAERRFAVEVRPAREHPGCACPEVLRGLRRPTDCRLFGTACTPDNPLGACMVSSEGACAAYWQYGRHREPAA